MKKKKVVIEEEENQRRSELEARNERRDYELDFAPYFAMEKTIQTKEEADANQSEARC